MSLCLVVNSKKNCQLYVGGSGSAFPYGVHGRCFPLVLVMDYLTSSYPFAHIQKPMMLEPGEIILPLRLFER